MRLLSNHCPGHEERMLTLCAREEGKRKKHKKHEKPKMTIKIVKLNISIRLAHQAMHEKVKELMFKEEATGE